MKKNINISEEHIKELYTLFKNYFITNKNEFELDKLRSFIQSNLKLQWNKNSLDMYISSIFYMVKGEIFKRAINNFAKKYFITNLCRDFDHEICINAKKSLKLHDEYMKKFHKKENIKDNLQNFQININKIFPLNQILYGPPGTGKTYKTIELAVEIVDKDFYEENKNNRKSLKKRFNELKKLHQIEFITFHQSFSYEDFIEGIKPDLNGTELRYKIEDGIFKRICNKAKENSDKNYVLIIDEINRDNIAKIFGELITLIEEDKRIGEDEELTTILPYSKSEFGVPSNLYIIGTMNTADRSLVYIDSALRRRFEFIEIEPNYDLLKEIDGINLSKLLKEINDNIEKYYDKDHILGHSYFLKVKSKEDIERVFKKQIIPLLSEYFYEDVCMLERFLDCEECKKIEGFK